LQQPSLVSTFLSCTCAFAILATTGTAASEEPTVDNSPSFGARGQVVLDDLLGVSTSYVGVMSRSSAIVAPSGWISAWRSSSEENAADGKYTMTRTSYTLAPTVDYFLRDGLSIGGSVFYQYADTEMDAPNETDVWGGQSEHAVGLAPRVGLAWPLGKDLSLWARLGGGYTYQVGNFGDGPNTRGSTWQASAEAMLVVQPSSSLFFAAGPRFAAASHETKDADSGATLREFTAIGGSVGAALGLVL